MEMGAVCGTKIVHPAYRLKHAPSLLPVSLPFPFSFFAPPSLSLFFFFSNISCWQNEKLTCMINSPMSHLSKSPPYLRHSDTLEKMWKHYKSICFFTRPPKNTVSSTLHIAGDNEMNR